MATRALRFALPVALEDTLHGFLFTHFTIEGLEETSSGAMICYIPDEEWTNERENELMAFLSSYTEIEFDGSELMEERDWNAEWESTIEAQQITDHLTVTPSWRIEQARSFGTEYTILIDPKMSFGTGHHETTRLCLRAIEAIDVSNKTVLDVGTGSGVLAIYALQRGAKHAVAIDTDEWSIDNATENRGLNGITGDQLDIRAGRLDQTIDAAERFDIILANIHRNVLVALAKDLKQHLNEGGSLVLSGLLIYDAEEVRTEYEAAGFAFVRQDQENEWVALTFAL